MTRRSWLIYGLLLTTWAVLMGWQAAEHARVRKAARVALINRAKDISSTLSIVLRSQRRFGGIISKERLEGTLTELVKSGESIAVALLNASGEVVASAGTAIDLQPQGSVRPGEHWGEQSVTLANLVDLGTNVTHDMEGTNRTIVLPRSKLLPPYDTNRPPNFSPGRRPPGTESSNALESPRLTPPPGSRPWPRRTNEGRPWFGRPFWMGEEEYKSVSQKQGVHSFVIVMSTRALRALCSQDLWLRSIIGILATVSALGSGVAWRIQAKSAELQLRLVRASELNSHLKEMNLAAAGLAHETRNPLNIIRGLAQMISKQETASPEIRRQSRDIVEETDRVTVQLNEFINYSRPREVRRSAVALPSIVGEVMRALSYDVEEKSIRLQVSGEPMTVEADEQLLRQALFNLLLNAIQAVEPNGEIQIAWQLGQTAEVILEIRDNGPGVPDHQRTEIFKPYFTTHQQGTGLGLAVVQQIVLAHGWEIECRPNQPQGACFRLTHLKVTAKS